MNRRRVRGLVVVGVVAAIGLGGVIAMELPDALARDVRRTQLVTVERRIADVRAMAVELDRASGAATARLAQERGATRASGSDLGRIQKELRHLEGQRRRLREQLSSLTG